MGRPLLSWVICSCGAFQCGGTFIDPPINSRTSRPHSSSDGFLPERHLGFASVFNSPDPFIQGPSTGVAIALYTGSFSANPKIPLRYSYHRSFEPTALNLLLAYCSRGLGCRDAVSGLTRFHIHTPQPLTHPKSSLMSETQDTPNLEDLTPEEANRIIHSHRKVRYGQCTPAPQLPRLPASRSTSRGASHPSPTHPP